MKIGVLTMPLKTNYGGLMQAYALQTVLKPFGEEVEILSRCYPKTKYSAWGRLNNEVVLFIRRLRGERIKNLNEKEFKWVSKNTQRFIDLHFNKSRPLTSTLELKEYVQKKGVDVFVVGSDQVWRPRYCPCVEDYFLGFTQNQKVKRIAYAASFGVSEWEYSEEESKKCSELAKKFDAISVREDSGVDLCRKYLGVQATHVLDPTMLLQKADYIKLAEGSKESKGNLFFYILDHDTPKDNLLKKIEMATGYRPYECMPQRTLFHGEIKHRQDCVFPAPEQWLRSFADAKMVVTDSFHGAAFSIIFNKPFWVIGNPNRGLARMESLLKMFGLSDRFVNLDNDNGQIDWKASVDWHAVNESLDTWRKESIVFLKNAINRDE